MSTLFSRTTGESTHREALIPPREVRAWTNLSFADTKRVCPSVPILPRYHEEPGKPGACHGSARRLSGSSCHSAGTGTIQRCNARCYTLRRNIQSRQNLPLCSNYSVELRTSRRKVEVIRRCSGAGQAFTSKTLHSCQTWPSIERRRWSI